MRPSFIQLLHRLRDKAPRPIRRSLLHRLSSVVIGVQDESGGIVVQDVGARLGVHAALDGQGGVL